MPDRPQSAVGGKPPPLARESFHVDVLYASRVWVTRELWNLPRLANNHWRLYQNATAGGVLVTDAGDYPLESRRVYLIPPPRRIGSRCDTPFRQFFVHFEPVGFPAIALSEMFLGPAAVPVSQAFEGVVEAVGEAVRHGAPGDLALEYRLQGIVCEALGRCIEGLPVERIELYRRRVANILPLTPALQHIQLHLAERITNGALADLCHLSEDYFIRRFRDALGVSPVAYIVERRVAFAAQRLLFTEDSVEQIAQAAGFKNRFYFSRVFAREIGTPPAAYRRSPRT